MWQVCNFVLFCYLNKWLGLVTHTVDMHVACFNIVLCMGSCCRSSRCQLLITREISVTKITSTNKIFWWCHLFIYIKCNRKSVSEHQIAFYHSLLSLPCLIIQVQWNPWLTIVVSGMDFEVIKQEGANYLCYAICTFLTCI